MKDRQTRLFLLWAFVLAWLCQAGAIVLARSGQVQGFQLVLMLSMFAPFAAVLLARIPLGGMGWRPRLRRKGKWFAAAWLGAAVLSALGGLLYFLVFPAQLDLSGGAYAAQLGEAGMAQLEAQGLTVQKAIAVQIAAALTGAPFLNLLPSLGEEAGWRGALYPRLKARFGTGKGRVLGGLIWGVWHWPVILLAGYNYGTAYWGAPVLGPLLFCVMTVALGTLFDLLYEKTGCIWIPALAHGAFNACAGAPVLFQQPGWERFSLLGPAPIGLVGGLPLLILAALVLRKPEEQETGPAL